MKTYKTLLATLFIVTLPVLLSGCSAVAVHDHGYEHGGPPPHAPAHGYRHKHKHHDLEYNSDLGIYVVIGLPDHYFIDGIYYKRTKHGWYSSHDADKGWKEYKKDNLPGKLDKKYGHKKGHGKHKDKHGKSHKHDD